MKHSSGVASILLVMGGLVALGLSGYLVTTIPGNPFNKPRLNIISTEDNETQNDIRTGYSETEETPQKGITEVTRKGEQAYPLSGESFRMPEPEPKPNDAPTTRVINFHTDHERLNINYPVYLSVEAKDLVGGIDRVEYFLNGKHKKTIQKRDMHLKISNGYDSKQVEAITKRAIDYVEDKYGEEDVLSVHRTYFEEDGSSFDCDVKEGYLIILAGKENFYDTRVSRSEDIVDVCYKSKGFNYLNYYNLLFYAEAGDYDYYAIAYDISGKQTKSKTKSFSVN